MHAIALNGKITMKYTTREAAQTMVDFFNQYGDGIGRKGYALVAL